MRRCEKSRMDACSNGQVVECLKRCRCRLIFFELRCLDNHLFRAFATDFAHVQDKIITIWVMPIRAEHLHQPPAAGLVKLVYVFAGGGICQSLPCPYLSNAVFHWRA